MLEIIEQSIIIIVITVVLKDCQIIIKHNVIKKYNKNI